MTNENICYCGEYGGGAHTKSARCGEQRPSKELITAPENPSLDDLIGFYGEDNFRSGVRVRVPYRATRLALEQLRRLRAPTACEWCEQGIPKAKDGRRHESEYGVWACSANEPPAEQSDIDYLMHCLVEQENALKACEALLKEAMSEGWNADFDARMERYFEQSALLGDWRSRNLRLSQPPRNEYPEELFDGYAVEKELTEQAKKRTSAENVVDVLDSVVRLIRKRHSETKSSAPADPDEETPCPKREDGIHCECWYGGNPCCGCGRSDILDGRAKPPCSASGEGSAP